MSMQQQKKKKNYRKRTVEELEEDGKDVGDRANKNHSDDEEERRYRVRGIYRYRKVFYFPDEPPG